MRNAIAVFGLAIMLSVAVCLTACGGNQVIYADPYFSIRVDGKVVDAATSQPLEGIRLELIWKGMTNMTMTAKDGSYALDAGYAQEAALIVSDGTGKYITANIPLDFPMVKYVAATNLEIKLTKGK